jgi:hypothetical protein
MREAVLRSRFTPYERAILRGLVLNPIFTHDDMRRKVYGGESYSKASARAIVCKLKRKLEEYADVTVHSLYGEGWFVDYKDQAKLDERLRLGLLIDT